LFSPYEHVAADSSVIREWCQLILPSIGRLNLDCRAARLNAFVSAQRLDSSKYWTKKC
jgi:hypothetical protein